ncbi:MULTISPECIES: hypothetical protein [Simplicispira]|nr:MULTISPECIES: hypothetical protein [Simplicispira]MBP7412412.1 hypothetical protein [Giesbergeria sp.]MBP8204911.1 hypothetical protein [Giesbergeria sp.]MDD2692564.1 hypothetical protein [Simplicispira sp.]
MSIAIPPMSPTRRQRIRKRWLARLAGAAAVLALLAVFALYTQPEFMVMLADQVWACF